MTELVFERMGAPTAVQLLGQTFAIEFVDPDADVLRGAATDMERIGTVRLAKQVISVARDLGPDQERDTILHEVLHALIRVVNLMPKERQEERIVVALAPLILDALRRNPDLVAYLTEPVERMERTPIRPSDSWRNPPGSLGAVVADPATASTEPSAAS